MERAPLPPKDVLWRKAPLLIAFSGGSVPPKILKVEVACHRRRKPRLGRRQSSLQISGRRAVPVRHEDKSIPRMLGKLVRHEAWCWACWACWAFWAAAWARVKTRVWSWRCSMAQKPPPSPGVCSCHRVDSWLSWLGEAILVGQKRELGVWMVAVLPGPAPSRWASRFRQLAHLTGPHLCLSSRGDWLQCKPARSHHSGSFSANSTRFSRFVPFLSHCFVLNAQPPAVAFLPSSSSSPNSISQARLRQIAVRGVGAARSMLAAQTRQKGSAAPPLRMTTFQGFSCAINHKSSTTNHSQPALRTRIAMPARNFSPRLGPPEVPRTWFRRRS
jgi:hypothetical protein